MKFMKHLHIKCNVSYLAVVWVNCLLFCSQSPRGVWQLTSLLSHGESSGDNVFHSIHRWNSAHFLLIAIMFLFRTINCQSGIIRYLRENLQHSRRDSGLGIGLGELLSLLVLQQKRKSEQPLAHTSQTGLCYVSRSVMSDSLPPDPIDCSPPGSSVHGISQASILEWVAISFSKGISLDQRLSLSPAWAGGFFLPLSRQGSPLHTVEIGKTGEKSSPSSLRFPVSL